MHDKLTFEEDKEHEWSVQVRGDSMGKMLIRSKYNRDKGVIRELNDLDWTLKAFAMDNPFYSSVGTRLLETFSFKGKTNFFGKQK